MQTAIERSGAKANLFMTLTTFGEHILHHMFPSIDHALLTQLNEVFLETCSEFKEEIKECSIFSAFWGQLKQLKRTETID
jgi:fatty acid desaturase